MSFGLIIVLVTQSPFLEFHFVNLSSMINVLEKGTPVFLGSALPVVAIQETLGQLRIPIILQTLQKGQYPREGS